MDSGHTGPARSSRAGWYVAAACLLLAGVGWWPRLQLAVPTVLQARIDGDGSALRRWAWVHESGLAPGIEGEVVWDSARHEGYLVLAGLAPNAPSRGQYQVWIFDAGRDDRYPVNGGVFDVPEGASTVTVPIRPTLRVQRPTAFAITLERAGGVVVSDRSHLMAMARATSS